MATHVYINSYLNPRRREFRSGNRNVKDQHGRYNTNSPYNHVLSTTTVPTYPSKGDMLGVGSWANPVASTVSEKNRLYEKVRETVTGPKGELLTSAVEWKSSLDMISSRAIQLGKAYSALRSFQFAKVARILEMPRFKTQKQPHYPKGYNRKKVVKKAMFVGKSSPSSAWLEYWMGWAPLMGDIGHALDTISRPPPLNQRFSEGVRVDKRPIKERNGSPTGALYRTLDVVYEGTRSAYGKYRVTNHNLMLAQQLGFTNPILTAWQIVPFSFIIDWFTNVGQVIGSLTDFVGVTFVQTGQAYRTKTLATASELGYFNGPWDGNRYPRVYYSNSQSGCSIHKMRAPGPLPTPRLLVKPLNRLSLTRAATSVSLLYEIFLRK